MTASSSFQPARTLIVYFSFTGNTETVARLLQKHTGATLMALERPADYLLGLDDDENGPEPLEPDQVNLSDYDLVFLGFPIWTSQLPAAVESWLGEHALAGHTVAPFCTHSGPGPGQAFNTLRTLCPDAQCSTRWKTSSWPRPNGSFTPGLIPSQPPPERPADFCHLPTTSCPSFPDPPALSPGTPR